MDASSKRALPSIGRKKLKQGGPYFGGVGEGDKTSKIKQRNSTRPEMELPADKNTNKIFPNKTE